MATSIPPTAAPPTSAIRRRAARRSIRRSSNITTIAAMPRRRRAMAPITSRGRITSSRDRTVSVEIAVPRDREIQAMAELTALPVAILSHGNTVKHTEYSFLSNVFAARGYLVISIQHDLATDDPIVTKAGEEYVGR